MLDPFEALAGDMPSLPHDVLERQSFSLANAKDATPIIYHRPRYAVAPHAVLEDGIATIWVWTC